MSDAIPRLGLIFGNKYRTAVFNPLKLKFSEPSMLRGKSKRFGSPPRAFFNFRAAGITESEHFGYFVECLACSISTVWPMN